MVAAAQEIQRSRSRQKAEEAGNFSSFLPMASGDLLQCHRNGAANLPSTAASCKNRTRCWRKGNPLALLVGMQSDTATAENCMEIPLKIRNKTTI